MSKLPGKKEKKRQTDKQQYTYKGKCSIPLFKSHKSTKRKSNPGYKLKPRETHQL